MKLWPFGDKLETRAESSYTDTLIAALVSRAQGKSLGIPTATAALESVRGYRGARICGLRSHGPGLPDQGLDAWGIGDDRPLSLIRTGELVLLIDTQAGRLRLVPAETHDVEGGPFPEEWEYTLTLGGPSKTVTYGFVPATSVLHFRYAADPARPWRGNGPVEVAALAGKSERRDGQRAWRDESPAGRLAGSWGSRYRRRGRNGCGPEARH